MVHLEGTARQNMAVVNDDLGIALSVKLNTICSNPVHSSLILMRLYLQNISKPVLSELDLTKKLSYFHTCNKIIILISNK